MRSGRVVNTLFTFQRRPECGQGTSQRPHSSGRYGSAARAPAPPRPPPVPPPGPASGPRPSARVAPARANAHWRRGSRRRAGVPTLHSPPPVPALRTSSPALQRHAAGLNGSENALLSLPWEASTFRALYYDSRAPFVACISATSLLHYGFGVLLVASQIG